MAIDKKTVDLDYVISKLGSIPLAYSSKNDETNAAKRTLIVHQAINAIHDFTDEMKVKLEVLEMRNQVLMDLLANYDKIPSEEIESLIAKKIKAKEEKAQRDDCFMGVPNIFRGSI